MLRTLWVWCVGIFLTMIIGAALILVSFLDPRGRAMRALAGLWAKGILAAAGVDVRVYGLENLLPGSPQILAANHQGFFDIFALFAYIPIYFGWIAKKELYWIPIFGYAMKRFGNIRIDRSDRDKALKSLQAAARRVREGQSVIIFPEGTRSRDGKVLPFKKGCFYLAEASRVPVVPISISGSFEVMPKRHFRIQPRTIHMVVGKPMRIEDKDAKNRNGFTEQLRQTIIENQVPVS